MVLKEVRIISAFHRNIQLLNFFVSAQFNIFCQFGKSRIGAVIHVTQQEGVVRNRIHIICLIHFVLQLGISQQFSHFLISNILFILTVL